MKGFHVHGIVRLLCFCMLVYLQPLLVHIVVLGTHLTKSADGCQQPNHLAICTLWYPNMELGKSPFLDELQMNMWILRGTITYSKHYQRILERAGQIGGNLFTLRVKAFVVLNHAQMISNVCCLPLWIKVWKSILWWTNAEHEEHFPKAWTTPRGYVEWLEWLPSGKLTWLWKITMFNGKTHYKWSFSIAMLAHERVNHVWIYFMKTSKHPHDTPGAMTSHVSTPMMQHLASINKPDNIWQLMKTYMYIYT